MAGQAEKRPVWKVQTNGSSELIAVNVDMTVSALDLTRFADVE
jgi:hypothetical protein